MTARTRSDYEFENHEAVDPALIAPVVDLLKRWDDAHDSQYGCVDNFFADATFVLGSTKASGQAAIRQVREGALHPVRGPITTIRYHLEQVWPLAGQAPSLESQQHVFTGNTDYTLRPGTKVNAPFAVRAIIRKDPKDGRYRFCDYMVFVNQVELTNAIAEMK